MKCLKCVLKIHYYKVGQVFCIQAYLWWINGTPHPPPPAEENKKKKKKFFGFNFFETKVHKLYEI